MLKIKPFLLSLSLSPLFLTSMQLPSQAQTTTLTFPSKGGAGFSSGVNPIFVLPRGIGLSTILKEFTKEQISRLREKALSRLKELRGISRDLLAEPTMSIDSRDRAIASLADITKSVNNRSSFALADGGAATVRESQDPQGKKILTVTITTKSGATIVLPFPIDTRPEAIATVIAILGVGGTRAQAEIAGSLVNSGANPTKVLVLIQAMSGLCHLKGIERQKSIDSAKKFTLAQASDQEEVDVDPNQLNKAIKAYNDLVDTSSPEVVAMLIKNQEFMSIGETLRQFRDSIR